MYNNETIGDDNIAPQCTEWDNQLISSRWMHTQSTFYTQADVIYTKMYIYNHDNRSQTLQITKSKYPERDSLEILEI